MRCGLCQKKVDSWEDHVKSKEHKGNMVQYHPPNKKIDYKLRAIKTIEKNFMRDGKTYEVYRGTGAETYRPQSHTSQPNGKSYSTILCPFCDSEIDVYTWSFWGGGKRCSCGAKLEPMVAYKEIKENGGERANSVP